MRRKQKSEPIFVDEDKSMGNGVTVIVGAGVILDLDPHISYSVFLRAISAFSGREYKYDPAQRVDTVIYREEKKFMTSKNSKWQRGRRIVDYLTEVFESIANKS